MWSTTNGHQRQSSTSSFLPEPESSSSFAEEIEREMNLEAADSIMRNGQPATSETAGPSAGSIMFPPTASSARRRPHSIGSMPTTALSSSGDTKQPQAQSSMQQREPRFDPRESAYGGAGPEEDDDAATSIQLGGSRPPSRGSTARYTSSNANAATSAARNTARDSTASASGFRYLDAPEEDVEPRDERRQTMGSARLVNGVRQGHGGLRESVRVASRQALLTSASRAQTPAQPSILQPQDEREAEERARPRERSNSLSPEEAWYMLRALVGQEIEAEEGQLWRLKNLEPRNESTRDLSTEDGEDLDEDLDAQEVPVLRYLIRHFLLTLPLVRDVSPTELDLAPTGGSPAYWTEGLYPIIRALHEADLSHADDRGSPSFGGRIYGIYIRKALERFVSAGLKLSSSGRTGPDQSDTEDITTSTEFPTAPSRVYNFQPDAPTPASPQTPTSVTSDDDFEVDPAPVSAADRPKANRFSFSNLFRVVSGSGTSESAPGMSKRNTLSSLSSMTKPGPPTLAPVAGATALANSSSDSAVSQTTPVLPLSSSFPPPPPAPTTNDKPLRHPISRTASHATGATGFASGLETASFVSARERATGDEATDYDGQDDDESEHEWLAVTADDNPSAARRSSSRSSKRTAEPYRVDDDEDDSDLDNTARLPAVLAPTMVKSSSKGSKLSKRSKDSRRKSNSSDKSANSNKSGTSAKSNQSTKAQPRTVPDDVPASRRIPTEDFVAHMALPDAAMASRPVTSAPLAVDLVDKAGVPWPYGETVPFWRGVPYERLKWGGFEADVVGVRSNIFSHSFIIRVRRPARLDEYVVRTEAQFFKYFKTLEKQYPYAHVRRIPNADPKEDQIGQAGSNNASSSSVDLVRPSPQRINSSASQVNGASGAGGTSQSRIAIGLRDAAADPRAASSLHSSRSRSREKRSSSRDSSFSRALRAQSSGNVTTKKERRNTISGASRIYSLGSNKSKITLAARLKLSFSMKKMPAHDARRRALRGWLRDTLSVRTVGHNKETALFLLQGSIVPKDSDVNDIYKRETIDEARRAARVSVAQGAAQRAKAARSFWTDVEQECIHGDGFVEISEAIKQHSTIEKLPQKYAKVLETTRNSFAQGIFEALVVGESAPRLFRKLKALHAAFPYFLVRQAFKFGGSSTMAKYLQDILLFRPFGSKSLLQKILAITLDDDPTQLLREASALKGRISSTTMCEKIEAFVYDIREKKDVIRQYAKEHDVDLVLCVVRGADEPRLERYELERVVRASKKYQKWLKSNPSPVARNKVEDSDVRLVLDLQDYLRLISRDRDANMVRSLLGEDHIARSLEVLAGPFVELLKRTYKVGNGSAALTNLQRFMDQLIIILEALRSRIQDPQKSVRIIARLLERHQHGLYDFLRSVHKGESIIEEFLQWFWTASVFLRRGLAQPVDINAVMPEDSEDKAYFLEELEELVAHHKRKRTRQYQNTCRRYAGDVDGDDPVIVEGDGNGRSRVEPLREAHIKQPKLHELPTVADAFRDQLKKSFNA